MGSVATHTDPVGLTVAPVDLSVYHALLAQDAKDFAAPTWILDGAASDLVPQSLTWAANGDVSMMTVKVRLGTKWTGGTRKDAEDQGFSYGIGDRMRLVQEVMFDDANEPFLLEWFRGYVGQSSLVLQGRPSREAVSYTVYGPELLLANRAVSGRWYARPSVHAQQVKYTDDVSDRVRANIVRTDEPCIFNPTDSQGRITGNCAVNSWKIGAADVDLDGAGIFLPPGFKVVAAGADLPYQAKQWTAYRALRAVVEMFDGYTVLSEWGTDWNAIYRTLGEEDIGTVNVEGMNLLRAIKAILNPIGFGFYIDPGSHSVNGDYKHSLVVYNFKNPAKRLRPFLPPFGSGVTDDNGLQGEPTRIHFLRDAHNVRNDVTVIGDRKRLQVSLTYESDSGTPDLVPFWHSYYTNALANYVRDHVFAPHQLEDSNIRTLDKRYNPKGEEFYKYRHVWRSFLWNEDGAFPDLGDPPDVSADLGIGEADGLFARIPRPVGPTFTHSINDKITRVSATVWIVAAGFSDVKVAVPAVVMGDRAGFTLTREFFSVGDRGQMEVWRPFANFAFPDTVSAANRAILEQINYLTMLHNTLRDSGQGMQLILTGSIEDDAAVKGLAGREPGSDWPFVAEKVVRAGHRFQSREISDALDSALQTDTVDESADAEAFAQRIRQASDDSMGHGSLVLRYLTFGYPPGTGIPGTDGRIIDFTIDERDWTATPIVAGVRFRFGDAPTTELLLDSPLLRVSR